MTFVTSLTVHCAVLHCAVVEFYFHGGALLSGFCPLDIGRNLGICIGPPVARRSLSCGGCYAAGQRDCLAHNPPRTTTSYLEPLNVGNFPSWRATLASSNVHYEKPGQRDDKCPMNRRRKMHQVVCMSTTGKSPWYIHCIQINFV